MEKTDYAKKMRELNLQMQTVGMTSEEREAYARKRAVRDTGAFEEMLKSWMSNGYGP